MTQQRFLLCPRNAVGEGAMLVSPSVAPLCLCSAAPRARTGAPPGARPAVRHPWPLWPRVRATAAPVRRCGRTRTDGTDCEWPIAIAVLLVVVPGSFAGWVFALSASQSIPYSDTWKIFRAF